MMTMTRTALGIAAVALLTGCNMLLVGSPLPTPTDDVQVCTLIGCESQVVFELDRDLASGASYQVRACIDDRCEEATVDVPPAQGAAVPAGSAGPFVLDPQHDTVAFLLGEGDFNGTHTVSLTVGDGSGEPVELAGDVEFEHLQPNGEGCEPICWQATLTA